MKGMTTEKRREYVATKSKERKSIQDEIQALNKKRLEYIYTNTPKDSETTMLDAAMIKAIKAQARTKNLTW